jgi:hypothetical protein
MTMRILSMKLMKITVITLVALLVVACGDGKYGGMTDEELRDKKRHCNSIPKKSAVFANGCEQIMKEIKRRKKNR